MSNTAILAVKIIGDATSAVSAVGQVDSKTASMASNVNKSAVVAGVGLALIGKAALDAGQAAATMEQSFGGVDAVFGEFAGGIHALAESAANDVNLSANAYSEMATILGAQLKNMGLPLEEATNKTGDLITKGADLAAQFGGTTSDAVGALSSLLRGETDPIERYGVSIKQADINAQLATMGLTGLTGEAEKNAKLQATLALLTQQTADATGAFGRETDSASSKQQNATAQWENAQVALGTQLLPLMVIFSTALADVARWAGDNIEIVSGLALGIGALALAVVTIAAAMKVWVAIQTIMTVVQWANNAAWLASPITWIILGIIVAIGLIIAIIVLWVQNWDAMGAAVAEGSAAMGAWFDSIGQWAADTFGPFIDWIKSAVDWIGQLFGGGSQSADFTATTTSTDRAAETLTAPSMARMSAQSFTAPTLPAVGSLAPQQQQQRAGDTYNITVRGSLDGDQAATQIESLLRSSSRRSGALSAAGVR